jgi:carbon-monoxide dehydrogenase medium subunit
VIPAPCDHHRPGSLAEALALLSRHGDRARVIAGGTDLVLKLRAGTVRAAHLVSINRIDELGRLALAPDRSLRIGAGVRLADVGRNEVVRASLPALAHACSVMATCQIRNQGTVAGNLANGSPCADTAAPLLAYDARVELASQGGWREIDLAAFYRDKGTVDIGPGELLTAIVVPAPPPCSGSCYERLSARSRVDMAAVGVAALVALAPDGVVATVRLALSAVAPTPLRCRDAEALFAGAAPTEALVERAAAACAAAARPIDDVRASAAYRRHLVAVLARRALGRALAQAKAEAPV